MTENVLHEDREGRFHGPLTVPYQPLPLTAAFKILILSRITVLDQFPNYITCPLTHGLVWQCMLEVNYRTTWLTCVGGCLERTFHQLILLLCSHVDSIVEHFDVNSRVDGQRKW